MQDARAGRRRCSQGCSVGLRGSSRRGQGLEKTRYVREMDDGNRVGLVWSLRGVGVEFAWGSVIVFGGSLFSLPAKGRTDGRLGFALERVNATFVFGREGRRAAGDLPLLYLWQKGLSLMKKNLLLGAAQRLPFRRVAHGIRIRLRYRIVVDCKQHTIGIHWGRESTGHFYTPSYPPFPPSLPHTFSTSRARFPSFLLSFYRPHYPNLKTKLLYYPNPLFILQLPAPSSLL
jgi:hypothetical protein